MSKPSTQTIPEIIDTLLAGREFVTSGEVASVAGVTRQAAHYHLSRMATAGQLIHVGGGRGSRYGRRSSLEHRYSLPGLEEHIAWAAEQVTLGQSADGGAALDRPNVKRILDWSFTEMLNNAIDHSDGRNAIVRWFFPPDRIAFEIEDDGVGAFRRMREDRGLSDDMEAIGEIAKGRQTSAPARHSGQGIFFTSKMVNRFGLSSGQLVWTVDAARSDASIGWLDLSRPGTLVRCEVDLATPVRPRDVFDAFTAIDTYEFTKSTLRVSLYRQGDFVSRSEAKRVASHLEDFEVVELDFTGVDEVGQGFVDELFRVWPRDHSQTRLVPVNANPAIVAMIAAASPGPTNPGDVTH